MDVLDVSSSSLLTVGNPKTVKGQRYGFRTAVLHLSPARLSGVANVCPNATPGCELACLNTAGRGGMSLGSIDVRASGDNVIQRARRRRTAWLFGDRGAFLLALRDDIARHIKRAKRDGLVPVVRLNGTSDIRWEAAPYWLDGASLFDHFPAVQFYDYTKLANRRGLPANYHLTFSLAETERNRADAVRALDAGLSVAVVLRGAGDSVHKRPFPATWNGRALVDGDDSDLRFLDPPSVFVGLRAKGRAKRDTSGFVYDVSETYDYLTEGGSDARTNPASPSRAVRRIRPTTADNGRAVRLQRTRRRTVRSAGDSANGRAV